MSQELIRDLHYVLPEGKSDPPPFGILNTIIDAPLSFGKAMTLPETNS